MSVSIFTVTHLIVRADRFPQLNDFSAVSQPTDTVVTRRINQAAAELEAKLAQESLSASGLEATGATTAEYLWCQETLTLAAAIRIATLITGFSSEVLDEWRDELAERWRQLEEKGYLALGGAGSAPAEQPDGPTHFIDKLSLDTSDNDASASIITAPFRRDDML